MQMGDKVEAHFAGGRTNVVRVVSANSRTVYITSERRYELALQSGKRPAPLLGLPKGDVVELPRG